MTKLGLRHLEGINQIGQSEVSFIENPRLKKYKRAQRYGARFTCRSSNGEKQNAHKRMKPVAWD